ncbi:hypothetical protein SDRG_16023 [Saprolegnia diclina VS20]|uniref:CobQ/CobB/MinD/ParA nucleotide binding domain-containing protein n=1 Tax=Saprolegnia diclina (strain VS20) TaxID=1156394 RepID=T0R9E3_SAPDV|nr:hypothetical protein SDRG_16023 [Saprolegnia diclina VS20]EQC26132.1 hypothetical protein SDRG_16023 [Saprolegnia diclina VS20]|eukprot:XP_008620434.1 hypothetical protein SDRG_16023 [Saprolegnia diclina VS20]
MVAVHVRGSESGALRAAVALVRGLEPVMDVHLTIALSNDPLVITVGSGASAVTCANVNELAKLLRRHIHWLPPPSSEPLRLFVAGDKSQVGKSTTCMALLGAFLKLGYRADELAYIKPTTQCEAPQMISTFCTHHGIAAVPIGPVVFFSGFTRSFLDQPDQQAASSVLLDSIRDAVRGLSRGKRIVVVDGVGYPSVGSICGVSNADVASALRPISVLLVGKPGVGDAVDSFNLNASYFEAAGLRVLGAVFNRLPAEGYYCLANCERSVRQYFAHHAYRDQKAYGFVPEFSPTITDDTSATYEQIVSNFTASVDVVGLLRDARNVINATPKRRLEPLALPESPPLKKARPLTIAFQDRSTVQTQAAASGAASS